MSLDKHNKFTTRFLDSSSEPGSWSPSLSLHVELLSLISSSRSSLSESEQEDSPLPAGDSGELSYTSTGVLRDDSVRNFDADELAPAPLPWLSSNSAACEADWLELALCTVRWLPWNLRFFGLDNRPTRPSSSSLRHSYHLHTHCAGRFLWQHINCAIKAGVFAIFRRREQDQTRLFSTLGRKIGVIAIMCLYYMNL